MALCSLLKPRTYVSGLGLEPKQRLASVLLIGFLALATALPLRAEEWVDDLTEWSLEDLMNVQVSLVSRKEEALAQAPAAVSVITREDIRRAGITSLPEALRLVPGVHVARIDANKWAISVRGFNNRFANKLLVQIDGRSIYNFSFSGVYWEGQDLLLEDLERIEVIRGPGATLWGSNAVNGIINIVTRPARDSQGLVLLAGGGSEERAFGGLRYGGQLGAHTHYRLYSKYNRRQASVDAAGRPTNDGWDSQRLGFRLERQTDGQALTLQGDLYDSGIDQTLTVFSPADPLPAPQRENIEQSGANLMGRWQRTFSPEADLTLQVYYDRFERREWAYGTTNNTLDVDFQHHFSPTRHHDLVWGGGLRWIDEGNQESFLIDLQPIERRAHRINFFAQDNIDLIERQLSLILGAKFEHNTFSDYGLQPNMRLLWTPYVNHTFWGAASRAIRAPSRIDRESRIVMQVVPAQMLPEGVPPTFLALWGNRSFSSERLHAYEVGYRFQQANRFFLDLATFYNDYDGLANITLGNPQVTTLPVPHVLVPLIMDNSMSAHSYGVELKVDWRPAQRWQLVGSYAYLHLEQVGAFSDQIQQEGNALGQLVGAEDIFADAEHLFSLRSLVDLPHGLRFDTYLRYTGKISAHVGGYTEVDLRLGWQLNGHLELSVTGQNLLADHHAEFMPVFINSLPTEVERGIYGAITWNVE